MGALRENLRENSNIKAQQKACNRCGYRLFVWQREKDSNPHIRSQSPLCYLYTIPLNANIIIPRIFRLSRVFSPFLPLFARRVLQGARVCRGGAVYAVSARVRRGGRLVVRCAVCAPGAHITAPFFFCAVIIPALGRRA